MVIQPGLPNDNLPSDCASAASVVLSSLAGGDGSARVPAKINFKMWGIFIIRAFLQRACLLIISVAFAGHHATLGTSASFVLASRSIRDCIGTSYLCQSGFERAPICLRN